MSKPRLADDIMVKKLHTLQPEQNVLLGIRQLLRCQISGAPVIDQYGVYQGVFSEKCCMNILSKAARLATERGQAEQIRRVRAKDIMQTRLVTLDPEMDVFDAIGFLLRNRISGAPVIDGNGEFVGVFSEKGSMDVVIESAYSQLPTTRVLSFMDADRGRVIHEHTDLLTVARIFLETPYRRLVVLRDEKVVGQISRRDVLNTQIRLSESVWNENTVMDRPAHMVETLNLTEATLNKRPPRVFEYMDTSARTIVEEDDLLKIAQLFRSTPYRRLPVLNGGYLTGQVSRRDLLRAAHHQMAVASPTDSHLLYLSSLMERGDSPIYSRNR
ncbi:MAG: CBS domain-containing protein [Planctomycetaceae bacterium]|nr:CBS domain-containing protein [Planctomycetaceae bacterium]